MVNDDEGEVPRPEPIEDEPAVVEDGIDGPALLMDRYHLRAPTFCGTKM